MLFLLNSLLRVNNTLYISYGKEGKFLQYTVILAVMYMITIPISLYFNNVSVLLLSIVLSNFAGIILTTLGLFEEKRLISLVSLKLVFIGLIIQVSLLLTGKVLTALVHNFDLIYVLFIAGIYLVYSPRIIHLILMEIQLILP